MSIDNNHPRSNDNAGPAQSPGPNDHEPELLMPDQLADKLSPWVGTHLLAFDVDGVLAPLVGHADDSQLSPGVAEALVTLSQAGPTAVVSGRSVESLERVFGFPDSIWVVGSHGSEIRGGGTPELDDDELYTMEQLELLGTKTVEAIGDGAWLEEKPTSVVVHTRNAAPDATAAPLTALRRLAGMVDGVTIKPGDHVVELMARHADKGSALIELSQTLNAPIGCFAGDDVTDEDGFAVLDDDAVSVKVGDGPTRARYRLADPAAVAETLLLLTSR